MLLGKFLKKRGKWGIDTILEKSRMKIMKAIIEMPITILMMIWHIFFDRDLDKVADKRRDEWGSSL